jgi:hypothetical protein
MCASSKSLELGRRHGDEIIAGEIARDVDQHAAKLRSIIDAKNAEIDRLTRALKMAQAGLCGSINRVHPVCMRLFGEPLTKVK